MRDLEALRHWFNGQDVTAHSHMRCESLERGIARVTMLPPSALAAPNGAMNGGHLSSLVENAAGLAVMSTRAEDVWAGAIEMNLQFLAPVMRWPATVTATLVRGGKRLAFVDCQIQDADHTLCVRGSAIHSLTTSTGWRCG